MTLIDFLKTLKEDVPQWLLDFREGDPFPREEFLNSRIMYYPGPSLDGHGVRVFASSHSAHCFVHADYGLFQQDVERELQPIGRGFKGYHPVARIALTESDLTPYSWKTHIEPHEIHGDPLLFNRVAYSPFGIFHVEERDFDLDDSHGPERFAFLHIGADGFATYDALFCQNDDVKQPFAVLVQDHGLGGNYDKFGRGGLLELMVHRANKELPPWILVADNTRVWDGYRKVEDVEGDPGGQRHHVRFLYRRDDSGVEH